MKHPYFENTNTHNYNSLYECPSEMSEQYILPFKISFVRIKQLFKVSIIQLFTYLFAFSYFFFAIEFNSYGQSKKKMRIDLVNADSLNVDEKKYGKGNNAIFGNVKFRHETTDLFCDSAFQYNDSNYISAYGRVHIIQDDSIHLYGDELTYFGNTSIANVRKNVKMINGNVTLLTDFLDYDRKNAVAYYFNRGSVKNAENTLNSNWGFYHPNTNELFFKDSVTLYNPDYTIFSDTLKYHTQTEIASILGPTFIVNNSSTIYSEDGYYDTKNDYAQLLKNSYVQGKEQLLKGDTINYNRITGIGEVFSNMEIIDTINSIIIKGDYGFYNELTKEALSTKNAQLLQYQNGDTLFLHADTLRSDPIPDTTSNIIRAYHKVKFYRRDMQGMCDSMVYNQLDSTNTMYKEPVIWSEGSQMTAQQITMFNKNNVLDRVALDKSAFIISLEDSSMYNQIKGRDMMGYLVNNEIYKIDVDGNAQTIYYPKDGDVIIGVNKAESTNMTIFFKERKPNRIILRNQPSGIMNPPYLLPAEELKLQGFIWLEYFRPKNKFDIFKESVIPKSEARKTYNEYYDEGVGNLKN
ncbi:MAG: organic solvent tolerance protein OstA [Marinilabiliaceae bacterium]|nr:organic solvent tolerance protein OstA [Marinilabiliaceae bacterium]